MRQILYLLLKRTKEDLKCLFLNEYIKGFSR